MVSNKVVWAGLLLLSGMLLGGQQISFRSQQQQHTRVKQAYTEKEALLKAKAKDLGFSSLGNKLLLRAFKQEQELEAWIYDEKLKKYRLFTTYPICAISGELGPKRKEGDLQIPEGFYTINHYNPKSNYHLSLGINYPNASDCILSDKKTPGSAIYIHGACVTIGCLPMTDEWIKEIYVLAVEAKNKGHQVDVHIFPMRMTTEKYSVFLEKYKTKQKTIDFWATLKKGYEHFENTHTIPFIYVNKKGEYVYK